MKTVVVGGGASGLMAAIFAAKGGCDVTLLERNEKLGKKIYITGKGRCNVTNACDVTEFLTNVVRNPKFLLSALNSFSPSDTMAFFEERGFPLKVERGNRVYPVSEKASDITKCLETELKNYNVKIKLNTYVNALKIKNNSVAGVITNCGEIDCDRIILCTGGITYSATGSDGNGFSLAEKAGHTVIEPRGALVGLRAETAGITPGLSLKNVKVSVIRGQSVLASEFGEVLITHTGISGPAVLTVSSYISRIDDFKGCFISLDLKPALTEQELDLRLQRDFRENSNKMFGNSLGELLPLSLIQSVIERSGISAEKRVHQITAEERNRLVNLLKGFTLKLHGTENVNGAVVTSGGVSVSEINPSTMESRLVKGLYFAGEMIDVDALTGGYNMQIAFSTGAKAGAGAAKNINKG